MSTSEMSRPHLQGLPPVTPRPARVDGDAATLCRCDARVHTAASRSGGAILVLIVLGEIDLSTLPVLRCALDAALAGSPAHLVVDLAGVGFCGAGGHSLMADRARTAGQEHIGYLISGMHPSIARHASLLWSAPVQLHCDLAAALSVLGGAGPDGPAGT